MPARSGRSWPSHHGSQGDDSNNLNAPAFGLLPRRMLTLHLGFLVDKPEVSGVLQWSCLTERQHLARHGRYWLQCS